MRSFYIGYLGSLLGLAAGAVLLPVGCDGGSNSHFWSEGGGGAGGAGGDRPNPDADSGTYNNVGTCTSASACSLGWYCDFPDSRCGEGVEGTCKPRDPEQCVEGDLGCGCDRLLYHGAGCAQLHGQDLTDSSKCETPPGTIPCGPYFCIIDDGSYCVESKASDGSCTSGSCQKLPDDCDAKDCSCLPGEMGTCSEKEGGVRVVRTVPPEQCPGSP